MANPNRITVDPLAVKMGQAAELLGISRQTLWRKIQEGKIKKNSMNRISMKQLQAQADK